MSERDGGRLIGKAGLSRRQFLQFSGACLALAVSPVGQAAISVVSVRVWPAKDYTRVTLECKDAIAFSQFIVKDPERLVVDLEGVEFNAILQNLPNKILPSDPYIKLIRAGRNKPGTVRLVIDLKAEIAPQVFTLKPVGIYGHRLVIDLYPAQPEDPLLALVRKLPEEGGDGGTPGQPASPTEPAQANVSDNRTGRQEAGKVPDASPPRNVQKAAEAQPDKAPERSADRPADKIAKAPEGPENRVAATDKGKKRKPEVARMVTIVIDPGHGGEDPGAIGKFGTMEKEVTLEVGKRLRALIEEEPNMRSMLTRDGDYFIPLGQRVVKARKVQADLFVSIHADAFVKSTARGSSVFVLSEHGASSAAARLLAQTENNADLVGGVNVNTKDTNLARTLLDLSQTATMADSLKLGKAVLSTLGDVNTLHAGKVEQAAFAVLKAPDIPSILVETAFISNPQEEERLNDAAYQNKIAHAILKGIKHYLQKNPPAPKSPLG